MLAAKVWRSWSFVKRANGVQFNPLFHLEWVAHGVCRTLDKPGIKAICLFIEPHNQAAMRVYGRVGFIGLDTGVPHDRTEEWEEVGFEGVELLKF
jgi:hypothetical protein